MEKKVYEYIFQNYDEETPTKDTLVDMSEAYGRASLHAVRAGIINALAHKFADRDAVYLDPYGLIHVCDDGVHDDIFSYVFVVTDDDWYEVTGDVGELLDEHAHPNLPENVRACFEKVYNEALKYAEKEEEPEI